MFLFRADDPHAGSQALSEGRRLVGSHFDLYRYGVSPPFPRSRSLLPSGEPAGHSLSPADSMDQNVT